MPKSLLGIDYNRCLLRLPSQGDKLTKLLIDRCADLAERHQFQARLCWNRRDIIDQIQRVSLIVAEKLGEGFFDKIQEFLSDAAQPFVLVSVALGSIERDEGQAFLANNLEKIIASYEEKGVDSNEFIVNDNSNAWQVSILESIRDRFNLKQTMIAVDPAFNAFDRAHLSSLGFVVRQALVIPETVGGETQDWAEVPFDPFTLSKQFGVIVYAPFGNGRCIEDITDSIRSAGSTRHKILLICNKLKPIPAEFEEYSEAKFNGFETCYIYHCEPVRE